MKLNGRFAMVVPACAVASGPWVGVKRVLDNWCCRHGGHQALTARTAQRWCRAHRHPIKYMVGDKIRCLAVLNITC